MARACRWAAAAPPEPARAEHVVIITVDTLRADRVGAYGHAAARTPALDAIAAGFATAAFVAACRRSGISAAPFHVSSI